MKVVWIVATIVLVAVGGGSVWLYMELDSIQKRYDREFGAAKEEFRRLDGKFPYAPGGALAPDRLDAYLRVRQAAAGVFDERSKESSAELYHAHGTQIAMFQAMAAAMDRESMSLREYCSLARRVQAILRRGDDATAPAPLQELRKLWASALATSKHPEGPPLPEPDRSSPQADVDLVVARAAELRRSMNGDMLVLVLRELDESATR